MPVSLNTNPYVQLVRLGLKPAALVIIPTTYGPALPEGLESKILGSVMLGDRTRYAWSIAPVGSPHAYRDEARSLWAGLGFPSCCETCFNPDTTNTRAIKAHPFWADKQLFFTACEPECPHAMALHTCWWRALEKNPCQKPVDLMSDPTIT